MGASSLEPAFKNAMAFTYAPPQKSSSTQAFPQGYAVVILQVDDLTKGALVVKEDLAKVELYGCMAALKDVRAKCVKMNECIIKAEVFNTNGMEGFDMNIRQCENYGISRKHA